MHIRSLHSLLLLGGGGCMGFAPSSRIYQTRGLSLLPPHHRLFPNTAVPFSTIQRAANNNNYNNSDSNKYNKDGMLIGDFHPFDLDDTSSISRSHPTTGASIISMLVAAGMSTMYSEAANAMDPISQGYFNPENFRPVCQTSDGFYRFLQGTTQAIVGEDQFVEYGPLIAGGLLRVRLELCVVESFFNEAVGPFIQQNGLSWILPLHETVETFLAGTIFALATTFILVGSTKIVAVIVTYGDVFVGGPFRLLGGFFFDRARGKPVTLDVGIGPWKKRLVGPKLDTSTTKAAAAAAASSDEGITGILESLSDVKATALPLVLVSGGVKSVGEVSKIIRDITEGIDIFIGRYLVLIATGYIGLKFVHFKIFPDFPPF